MPGKVKVRVLAGRRLPVMDKSSDTSDAFVEVKLGNTTYKTEVFRRSLNPYWNSEWFRFEVDDEELQDEPLQIRIMDYDTYSANDAIGKVYIDLNPLLNKDSGHMMTGWFPIYDTMHGIRGEVNCVVKVDLFSDTNRFRQSSCGIRFFYSPGVPFGYICQAIVGFVEELVVNDDPEYHWIDKIRTPRASNEARQTLFSKLSGEVQRKIGLKALELGSNAVLGYQQCFDLEGESGIVVRGIGTAVILNKCDPHVMCHHCDHGTSNSLIISTSAGTSSQADKSTIGTETDDQTLTVPLTPTIPITTPTACIIKQSTSPNKVGIIGNPCSGPKRGSSDPELSSTPRCIPIIGQTNNCKFTFSPESIHLLEYPFITMKTFPDGLIQHIGGVVSSRSVKLLDQINNPEEPETRDAWWMELRKEIRSHCRALGCNAVLGYTEFTNICDEVVVLSASGTAVCLTKDESITNEQIPPSSHTESRERFDGTEKRISDPSTSMISPPLGSKSAISQPLRINVNSARCYDSSFRISKPVQTKCTLCHIPYSESSIPYPTSLVRCYVCKLGKVPDVLFMTIEPPRSMPVTGIGCLIQARVCRLKRESKGEQCAKDVSDSLPFLEYELHRQLLSKLKVKGMNALFGLSVQVSVGDNMMIALATGTGAYLNALPTPQPPKISSGKGIHTAKLAEIQRLIQESVVKNREHYGLIDMYKQRQEASQKEIKITSKKQNGVNLDYEAGDCNGDSSGAEEVGDIISTNVEPSPKPDIDLSAGNKDGCVLLEVDDTEDADIISLMIDSDVPQGYEICNTEVMPGLQKHLVTNLQTFSQVYRAKITTAKQFGQQFDWIIQSLFVKLRKLVPCCLTGLKFKADLPEQDLVQITVLGTAVGMSGHGRTNSQSFQPKTRSRTDSGDDSDILFTMDDDQKSKTSPQAQEHNQSHSSCSSQHHLHPNYHHLGQKQSSSKDTQFQYYSAHCEPHNGVELTPLSYIPGAQVHHYLGNLDFFFIRESTSIRECGGLNGFMHSFLTEVLAVVRAHVASLGGNAMIALHLTQCVLLFSPHKNQAQCLINVAGDAAKVQYGCSFCVGSMAKALLSSSSDTTYDIKCESTV